MRYQVDLGVAQLMNVLDIDERSLANELRINLAHVQRLRADQWTTIKRSELQALLCWGKKHGVELLKLEPSPLWRTFVNAEVWLFRGRDAQKNPLPSDARVEATLLSEFGADGCSVVVKNSDDLTSEEVREAICTKNCVFIGSPKHNIGSERALAAMWGMVPESDQASNLKKSPVHFVWEIGSGRRSAFGSQKNPGEKAGLYVSPSIGKSALDGYFVPVDWKKPKEYARWTGRGDDAGAFVVCNRPLNTDTDVTTVVLAGYSGFATLDMAGDFVGDALAFKKDDLKPGVVALRILTAAYKKTTTRSDSRERLSKGRRWYGPPWSQLKEAKKKR